MSEFNQEFTTIDLKNIYKEAKLRKEHGWRYVQTLAVNVGSGTDLIYSFMKDGQLDNVKIKNIKKATKIKSITDHYLQAFVWENEIHDLFGLEFDGIAIDFEGTFYKTAVKEPMTIVDKETIARKEKQAKIKAAMAAKNKKQEEAK